MNILVINAGSSTIKWQVVDPESGESSHSGLVEGLGKSPSGEDYRDALLTILEFSATGFRAQCGGTPCCSRRGRIRRSGAHHE